MARSIIDVVPVDADSDCDICRRREAESMFDQAGRIVHACGVCVAELRAHADVWLLTVESDVSAEPEHEGVEAAA